MGVDSKIAWTHHTYNPWWGCEKVSPACKNCYAEAFAKRTGHAVWGGESSPRRFFGDKHWAEPIKWNRAAEKVGERHRVFCASMADAFEARDDLDQHRARLWDLIEATPHLDWLLLTKRPEEIMRRIPERWRERLPSHIWCGTTVENQEMAVERIPHLLGVPARVRFLSCEPLLGPLDLDPPTCPTCGGHEVVNADGGTPYCPEHEDEMCFSAWLDPCADEHQQGINWVICGGESGPKARPLDVAWSLDVLRQCRAASVPVFMKQAGDHVVWDGASFPGEHWPTGTRTVERGDGRGWRVQLKTHAGGDPAEWPEDLRVRQFPEVEVV